MRLVRTVVGGIIALSVGLLPAAAGFAVAAKLAGVHHLQTMSAAMPEPCNHANPAQPGAPSPNDCTSMAACALKCFGFAGTALTASAFPYHPARQAPPPSADALPSQTSLPPFRPPRF